MYVDLIGGADGVSLCYMVLRENSSIIIFRQQQCV